ncbi:MAG: cytochrome ubiquinol oxidase subunit I [Deltaproteobacteria bacterium]|nr:cytochrome ubiquinol oxidase subunit I [Deltaproteobacteria bacterium]
MTELALARAQMAMMFAFHIVFAVAGMGMPLLMVIAEAAHRRTGKPVFLELAKRWARGTAVLFAVGAVSGTVLSFELGLLWPGFMAFSGGIVGLPFALEGFAFFAEAIFLGIYLYGWGRVSPGAHILAGIGVALGGLASGILVVSANAWMNSPAGFLLVDGKATAVDPLAAMANPAWATEAVHMSLAAFAASGFAVAGIHAYKLLGDRENLFHRHALSIALWVGGTAAVLLPVSGDFNARFLAKDQPSKLAAMEGQFRTQRGAPLRIGGIPDARSGTTRFAIEIPKALSLLAFHDADAEVKGLDAFPREEWPDPLLVHAAFQAMVACGTAMAVLALSAGLLAWRARENLLHPRFLLAVLVSSPLGIVAVQAGWCVTELGRQPWVIRGVMKTADAVTPVGGLALPFAFFSLLYLALGISAAWLLRREVSRSPSFPASDERPPVRGGEG